MKIYHVMCEDDNGEKTWVLKSYKNKVDAEQYLLERFLELGPLDFELEGNVICEQCNKQIKKYLDINIKCDCCWISCTDCNTPPTHTRLFYDECVIIYNKKDYQQKFIDIITENFVQNNAGGYWIQKGVI